MRGEKPGPRSPESREDVWLYRVPVDELRGMQVHMDAAWALLSPKVEYLRALKQRAKVEVLLGYSSNVDHGGFNIRAESLRLFTELGVDLKLYLVMLPDDPA
ncbi:MAG: DUF4279 domain-containing protein [Polyangiaceae bacterium]